MGTAVSTDMSTGNRPIESKWGIQDKVKPDGSVRRTAQLVIKGYMQPDWGETYALAVGKLTTFNTSQL